MHHPRPDRRCLWQVPCRSFNVDVDVAKIDVEGSSILTTDVMANIDNMPGIGKIMIPKLLDGFAGLDK